MVMNIMMSFAKERNGDGPEQKVLTRRSLVDLPDMRIRIQTLDIIVHFRLLERLWLVHSR